MRTIRFVLAVLLSTFVGLVAAAKENAFSADAETRLKIAVFDQQAAGGQGAAVDGLLQGLQSQGYDARRIADLQPVTLCVFDLVYLSDMHNPGNVHKQWRKSLNDYVEAGGSVLQTWHHHIFSEVGAGVQRVYGSRAMHVRADHPAVKGMKDFQSSYEDHIVERVGPKGAILIENEHGQPVAVAGQLGRGKVISTGLALAIPGGSASAAPRGDDARLLKGFLAWLRPDVPAEERIAAIIKTPQLCISPSECLVAAGLDAVYHAAAGCAGTPEVRLECDGATIEVENANRPDATMAGATVRHFSIKVPTAAKVNGRRQLVVRAHLGDSVLEQTVDVNAVYAEPPNEEVRGVWLHVREDRHPKTVMPELKRLGINMAVLRIAGGTAAFYASKVQPDVQDPLAPGGDWLNQQLPEKIWGTGGRQVRSEITIGHIFDHHCVTYEFAGGRRLYSHCRRMAGCANETSDIILGTKGTCDLMKNRIEGENPWRQSAHPAQRRRELSPRRARRDEVRLGHR
ncbi:MAG: hypothetical protein GXX96_01440 [Planctomycetaceae bacterium]|nr:hypothetical protein [Planctomycetaceae bacterium]